MEDAVKSVEESADEEEVARELDAGMLEATELLETRVLLLLLVVWIRTTELVLADDEGVAVEGEATLLVAAEEVKEARDEEVIRATALLEELAVELVVLAIVMVVTGTVVVVVLVVE